MNLRHCVLMLGCFVAGCAASGPGGLGVGYAQRNDYVCSPPRQALGTGARPFTFYPGPGPSFTAWYEPDRDQVALHFYRGAVHHLLRVPGGAGVLYADAGYAWNDDGTRGILTSTQNSLVWGCRRLQ